MRPILLADLPNDLFSIDLLHIVHDLSFMSRLGFPSSAFQACTRRVSPNRHDPPPGPVQLD
jgi:hypothetical protein